MENRSIIYTYKEKEGKNEHETRITENIIKKPPQTGWLNKEIYKFDKITLAISSNTVYNIYIR